MKSQEKCARKRKKRGVGSCPPGKCTVFGGGKCPNLGVVIVLLANDTQSREAQLYVSLNLLPIRKLKRKVLRCDVVKQITLKLQVIWGDCKTLRKLIVSHIFYLGQVDYFEGGGFSISGITVAPG